MLRAATQSLSRQRARCHQKADGRCVKRFVSGSESERDSYETLGGVAACAWAIAASASRCVCAYDWAGTPTPGSSCIRSSGLPASRAIRPLLVAPFEDAVESAFETLPDNLREAMSNAPARGGSRRLGPVASRKQPERPDPRSARVTGHRC
jgi:hypothetical protein